MAKISEKTFWVTNFSDKNVTLSDLYISVAAGTSVNLLDKKHYSFTEEQLSKSQLSGSIFRKRHLVAVRKIPPQMLKKSDITYDPHAIIPQRHTSIYEIKHETYEELNISDEELIKESKLEDNITSIKGK
jgi:hypothetical protein